MEKVLITGGAGFIGFHLTQRLVSEGVQVDILDDFSRGVKDPELSSLLADDNVNCLSIDLTSANDTAALASDYNYIFHLAAIIGVQHVLKQPYDVLVKNIDMLRNVIDVCRRQVDFKRLIYTSTSEVYAGTLKHFELPIPTPEDTPLALTDTVEPRTSYMLSKIYGEAMCQHCDLPYTVIRPHNVYGPRMGLSHVIPELLKRALDTKEGESLKVYSVSHKRTFCYIDDAIELLFRVVQNEKCNGATLNLGAQGPEISIGDLGQIILETVAKDLTVESGPITPGSPSRRAPDMTKAKDLTGFQAQVGLREGVARTFQWYNETVFQSGGITAK